VLVFALSVAAGALRADPAPTPTSSVRTNEALLSRLPKFNPAKSDAAKKAAAEEAARKAATAASGNTETKEKDGIVYLPDYGVVEKKVEQPRADEWLSKQELDHVAVRRMEAKMNTLDMILNRWSIPFLTPSFKARARADYEAERNAEENARLQHVIDVSDGKK
jgi:hypothetical protein